MPGSFVISLDFELMWGLRDRPYAADYADAILGARRAIPEILRRFARHEIRATWATVGLLFARTRAEMMAHMPIRRPDYAARGDDPFAALFREVGASEQADPYHFGRSLIAQIADTPAQEIATHGFAHLPGLEPGASLSAFECDLDAAISISGDAGHVPRSIVFPRNQMSELHVAACARRGITAFRGVPPGNLYASRPRWAETRGLRIQRLADGIMPLAQTFGDVRPGPCTDVPASRFLRPVDRRLPGYGGLHLRRIKAEMRHAAATGGLYHLWWHPHNFGRNTDANLAQLDRILAEFTRLHHATGFASRAMGDFARAAPRSSKRTRPHEPAHA